MTFESSITGAEIKERLQWLVKLRWAGCIGVLIVTHIIREIADLTFSLIPVYLILGFVAVYNAYFQYKLKLPSEDLQKCAIKQISLDFIALAAAVYFSGGCDSPFLYYYIFHIVISGIILPRKWTFRFAVVAIALPTTIMGLKHLGILPHFAVFRNEPMLFTDLSVIAAYGGVFISTLLLTAYFVTYLSDRLYKKQEEIRRLYILSEKLRSSIVMDEVIKTVREELSSLSGHTNIIYMPLDRNKLNLVYDNGLNSLSIPLTDKNIFTDTLVTCEAHTLESVVVSSEHEDRVFKTLMKDAKEIAVLPVRAAFSSKCYDYHHCPPDTGCTAYGSDDKRCWYISGTHCHGKIMRNITEKLKECVKCDMFMPVGIFIVDITKSSRLEAKCDLDACMRLLDAASLAISNAKLFEKTLELSEIDGLTGVKNRRTFLKLLDSEVHRAHRYNKSFGLMMMDIDYFKQYNDTHGHPQGDILLKIVADIIGDKLRDTDAVGRYGGEEFIALLPETNKEESIAIAERIRNEIENYKFPRAETQPGGRITLSVGVSSYPEDGNSPERVMQSADDALYSAKNMGRNRVVVANVPII
ncbi:MAG: GGDEF domain-containing protein [Nitrospirota bacterium]